MARTSRPCDGCGTLVHRTKPTGPISFYCDADCRPRCSFDGCDKPQCANGWCVTHNRQARAGSLRSVRAQPCAGCGASVPRRGPAGNIARYCGDECRPRCAVAGCDNSRRGPDWCQGHRQQQRRGVEFRALRVWVEAIPCKVCSEPPGNGYRQFCGDACWMLWKFYDGDVPSHRDCVSCGVRIDLTVRGKSGQRKKATVKFCRRCAQDYDKYKMTAAQLAERDGTDCGICTEPVDMTLRRKDEGGLWCASVDHVTPRAWGGTHEPDNLQLAHLHCNQRKSDRFGGMSSRSRSAVVA